MNWKILNKTSADNIEDIVKILLKNRGLSTKKEISEFLKPKNPQDFTAKDLGIDEKEIKKAKVRIEKAIKNDESIIVYGDYDADGICATAILWETLYELTKNVLPYIPERVSEGYGLNSESIKNLKLKIKNLGLIVTVDHGITADDKIKYAKELGIDVIVCDHHQINKKAPDCVAVVHTDKICATAISWYLSMSLRSRCNIGRSNPRQDEIAELVPSETRDLHITPRNDKNDDLPAMTNFLDLVAIATIADLEPLIGINRNFTKYGLDVLRKTSRCGLLAIIEEAGIKKEDIGTYEVGYIIAPRLNAMGRMGHALDSLRLLCTSCNDKAKQLASKLGLTNKERQLLTEETVRHARNLFLSQYGEVVPNFIIIDHESYQEGIIGLVAGKLVEEFYRPAIVISRGEIYSKASGRSISGFNIIEAIREHYDLLVDAGGHPMAAGFTVETIKIEQLKEKLIQSAQKSLTKESFNKVLKIDMEIPPQIISEKLYDDVQKMSPFGIGNPEPVFSGKVQVKDVRLVGNEGKHLKLTLSDGRNIFSAIGFGLGNFFEKAKPGTEVNIAYNIFLNEWNGNKKVELKVKDIKNE